MKHYLVSFLMFSLRKVKEEFKINIVILYKLRDTDKILNDFKKM